MVLRVTRFVNLLLVGLLAVLLWDSSWSRSLCSTSQRPCAPPSSDPSTRSGGVASGDDGVAGLDLTVQSPSQRVDVSVRLHRNTRSRTTVVSNGRTAPDLFSLGHADASKVAAATGAFTNDDPILLQSTGFVSGPEGRVLTAVYYNGAIGRLVPDDVLGLIDVKAQS